MRRSILGRLLLTTAFAIAPATAWAEESQDTDQDAAQNAEQIAAQSTTEGSEGENIIVTARKVTESLQDVPAAIDVIPSQQLAAMGVTDVRAVQFLVPSIRLNKQQAVVQMFIRGVGIASDAPGLDMGVAMTLNGIEQFREATGSSLFDIDRVEVLRGPQATTYGSNAAGGVINVVFERPGNNFEGRASAEFGNYDRIYVTAAQNFALGSDGQMRLAVNFLDHDGYATNGLGDEENYAARLTLTAQPADYFDFMIWGQYYHAGGIGDVGVAVPFVDPDDPWNQTWDREAILTHFPNQQLRTRDIDIVHLGGEFNVDLGGATLTYIPGYIWMDHLGHLVIDTGFVRILFQGDVEREQITQELRLSNDDQDARLQWLLGLYYYHLDTRELRTVAVNRSFNITDQPSQSIAGFAQLTYSLTDSFRVTGGLRYSEIDKEVTGSRFTPGRSTANPTPIPFSADLSWSHVDWKVGVEYDLTPDSLLYASVQTGYLGGGVNFFNSPTQSNEVLPEELLAYMVGMRNTFFNNRLRLNWEAFYYDWQNYQVGVFNVAAATNVVSNAPQSESYGFEVDADWLITEDDRLSLGVGVFHGEFTDFVIPQGFTSAVRSFDLEGFELPFAPELTATAGYERTFRFANGSRLVANALVQYTSEYWTSFSHGITRCIAVPPTVLSQDQCVDLGVLAPESWLANADLTYHARDDRWFVGLWARNIFDETILTSGGDGGMNPAGVVTARAASTLAPPRTYGIRLGVSW